MRESRVKGSNEVQVNRRRRNQLCIRLILLGLFNIVAYTIAYAYVGGDAWNGEKTRDGQYYVTGHFLHSVEGHKTPVSRGIWLYSYIHSLTIWPSLAAIVLSMLVLARPHIIATCRDGPVSGATITAVIGTVVAVLSAAGTVILTINFVRAAF